MQEKTILIANADRGFGPELVRQLSELGHTVFAASLSPKGSSELKRLCRKSSKHLCPLTLDPSDERSVADLAEELHYVSIDVLIHNIDFAFESCSGIEDFNADDMLDILNSHCLGPFRLVRELLPVLKSADHPLFVTLGSFRGCPKVAETRGDKFIGAFSQAALDLVGKSLKDDLRTEGIACVTLSRNLDEEESETTEEFSAKKMIDLILSLTPADAGRSIHIQ